VPAQRRSTRPLYRPGCSAPPPLVACCTERLPPNSISSVPSLLTSVVSTASNAPPWESNKQSRHLGPPTTNSPTTHAPQTMAGSVAPAPCKALTTNCTYAVVTITELSSFRLSTKKNSAGSCCCCCCCCCVSQSGQQSRSHAAVRCHISPSQISAVVRSSLTHLVHSVQPNPYTRCIAAQHPTTR